MIVAASVPFFPRSFLPPFNEGSLTVSVVSAPGITLDESDAILNYLYEHMENPIFQCRFRWRANSIAFWDNRCAQHNAINDYQGHRRLMHRLEESKA